MRKGHAMPHLKFDVALIGISGNCARNRHSVCFNLNCTCECHLGKAELVRRKGLHTVPKPGDPDFKVKDDKPFCDDQLVEGLTNEKENN